ncbi:hypothetical protein RA19_07375 [Leisingera sp. ANG-M1]|nr:hypothetical protein RA19_07375 [Leisingera sp. ANG-M1]
MTMKSLLTSFAAVGAMMMAPVAVAEEITMNAVTMTPKTHNLSHGFKIFIDEINAKFEGEFQINWRGGPEVIQMFGQADAARNGAIDIAFTDPSFYAGLVPAAKTRYFTNAGYDGVNAAGFNEKMQALHEGSGLFYLGAVPASEIKFHFYLREPIETLEDLKGRRIRSFPTVQPMVEALGAAPLVLPIGEIYTAMERGAIDGFVFGPVGWGDQFKGVVKQVVTPGFYQGGFNAVVNQDAWNEVPEELQARIVDFVRNDLAPRIDASWSGVISDAFGEMEAAGYALYDLPAAEQEKYQGLAMESAWETVAKSIDPETAAELRQMLSE